VKEIKKDFIDKPAKRRAKKPSDFEGSPDKVKAWC